MSTLARYVGHFACPRRHLSGCVRRSRVCAGAGPALADGSAAAARYRPLRRPAWRPRLSPVMLLPGSDGAAASRRDYALLGDEAKAMLVAYARGVNAFIALAAGRSNTRSSAASLPLGALAFHCGDAPDRFRMGSGWWKLWRAAALPIVGADNIAKLRFHQGGSDLCAGRPAWKANGSPPRWPILRARTEQRRPGPRRSRTAKL